MARGEGAYRANADAAPDRAVRGSLVVPLIGFLTLLCVLIPLFSALVYGVKLKTEAQAICVSTNAALVDELGRSMRDLTRLNPQARFLERMRARASLAYQNALLTGTPGAVLAAQLALRAAQGLQMLLAIRQRAILAAAEVTRFRYRRQLAATVRRHGGRGARLNSGSRGALAVVAKPPRAIAPEYKPARAFERKQAQTMRFQVDHAPFLGPSNWQTISCEVTLRKERNLWRSKIRAASARSNSRSWRHH